MTDHQDMPWTANIIRNPNITADFISYHMSNNWEWHILSDCMLGYSEEPQYCRRVRDHIKKREIAYGCLEQTYMPDLAYSVAMYI